MKALIVVDVQNDFCTGGNLAVKDGEKIIPLINEIKKDYDLVILTQDFHPYNHKSFASQWEGKNIFDVVQLNGSDQVLWPDHCVQNTPGADFHKDLDLKDIYIFKKGLNPEVDSYSGFFDNDKISSTGLSEFLKEKGVKEVHVCGLALDYCVKYTAIDAVMEGFKTVVLKDMCKAITDDLEGEYKILKENGIQVI